MTGIERECKAAQAIGFPGPVSSRWERFVCWLKNLRAIPTCLAMWHLGRVLRRDSEYCEGWRANIAMPIYDAINDDRTNATVYPPGTNFKGINFHTATHELANDVANRILKLFFDVPIK